MVCISVCRERNVLFSKDLLRFQIIKYIKYIIRYTIQMNMQMQIVKDKKYSHLINY